MVTNRKNLLNMLCDVGDLSTLVTGSENIENFLQRAVTLVSEHLDTPVCSIYLYDETAEDLELKATKGLNPQAVGRVRMHSGEGLVGSVMASCRPVCEGRASRNPQFKYFPETDELKYESFLAVPILKGVMKIGVLVVQHTTPDYFERADVTALKAPGAQLAAVLENARLLMDLQRLCSPPVKPPAELGFIKGQQAARGVAFARAMVWDSSHGHLISKPHSPESGTIADFRKALNDTTVELDTLQQRCARRLPESAALIFAAQLMILKDKKFIERIETGIADGIPASRAVRDVARHYIELFSESPRPYIREKVSDIEDIAGRLINNLTTPKGINDTNGSHRVVIARDL